MSPRKVERTFKIRSTFFQIWSANRTVNPSLIQTAINIPSTFLRNLTRSKWKVNPKSNLGLCLVFASTALFLNSASVSAQVQIELTPNDKRPAQSSDRRGIPAASLPCSAEEQTWWNALRDAGEKVMRSKGDKDTRQKFIALLQEGATKSYGAPIPDRKPLMLVQFPPQFTEEGRRKKINGVVLLRVELLADGTIGRVQILKGLGSGLDENAITAARKAVFLPGVKDGKFVNHVVQVEMSFNVY